GLDQPEQRRCPRVICKPIELARRPGSGSVEPGGGVQRGYGQEPVCRKRAVLVDAGQVNTGYLDDVAAGELDQVSLRVIYVAVVVARYPTDVGEHREQLRER